MENRGHVRGDKEFVFAQTDDGGRAVAGGDNLVGIIDGDHDQGKHASQFLYRLAHCFFENGPMAVAGFQIVVLDQVSNNFRVGLGAELVALFPELPFEGQIILDDTVVNDDDASGAVTMGVGVLLGGAAVRGPAGMSDTVSAIERFSADDFFEVAQLSFGAADLEAFAIAGDGDSGGVITAILEPPQAFDDDRDDFLLPHVSDNATHSLWTPSLIGGGNRVMPGQV